MSNRRYSMSFTAGGGVFRQESVLLAEEFLRLRDWKAVRDRVSAQNLLQARTASSARRLTNEIVSRLAELQPSEVELLVNGTPQEQNQLLWIAMCRRYSFIADFAREVLRESYLSFKTEVASDDYEAFFNRKAEWHPELDSLKPSTRQKLRQVIFKLLRDTDLVGGGGQIVPSRISEELARALDDRIQDLELFPISDSDLRSMVR